MVEQRKPKEILTEFHKKRGRNAIVYYSSFWINPGRPGAGILSSDKWPFFDVVRGLDHSKGLDLILHTPGGVIEATESIGDYLLKMFKGKVEVFVPFEAMSAGTMIACASKQIHMGKQSSIGPIDPQTSDGRSIGFIIDEFSSIMGQLQKCSAKTPVWYPILKQLKPGSIYSYKKALEFSEEIVKNWLKTGMFSEEKDAEGLADQVTKKLLDYAKMKSHGRNISIEKAREIGLKVTDFGENEKIETLIMELHASIMHYLLTTRYIKAIANHEGVLRYMFEAGGKGVAGLNDYR